MSTSHIINTIFWLCILSVIVSCDRRETDLKIVDQFSTDAVTSGSAIAVAGDSVFVVGDDADYVAKIHISSKQHRIIKFYENARLERVPRPLKHDLESCILAEIGSGRFLLAFGSGGISPYRDSLFGLSVDRDSATIRISMEPLYDTIRKSVNLEKRDINFEGAAFLNDNLLLLNRGKNFVVVIPWKHMISFITKEKLPPFNVIPIDLPVINKFPVGFSGACTLDSANVLFTASLEETTDFTKDGAVKGSFIGILRLTSDRTAQVERLVRLKDGAGNVLLDKLESIDVHHQTGRSIRAIALADNDDGLSRIIMIEFFR